MSDNIDRTNAADGPPEGLLETIRNRTKLLGTSILVPLKAHGPPLGEILAGEAPLAGEVARFCDGRSAPMRFLLTRTKDDPPTLLLNVEQWPKDWTLLSVYLCQFKYWPFEASKTRFSLGEEKLRPARDQHDQPPSAEESFLSLAAAGAVDEVEEDYVSLSLDTGAPAVEEPAGLAGSPGMLCQYFPRKGTLEVTASLPEGSDGEIVVAKLRSGTETVRRAVHLNYRLPDGRYKGNEFSFLPAAKHGEIELAVRPLTDDDLGLLGPGAVRALLGRQDYLSVPMERTDDGFLFSARWQDQREMAAEASTCWVLNVATGQ